LITIGTPIPRKFSAILAEKHLAKM